MSDDHSVKLMTLHTVIWYNTCARDDMRSIQLLLSSALLYISLRDHLSILSKDKIFNRTN